MSIQSRGDSHGPARGVQRRSLEHSFITAENWRLRLCTSPWTRASEGSGPPRGGGGTGGECIKPLNQHRTVRIAQVSSTQKGQPVCRGLRLVSEDEGVLVVE